MKVTVEGFIVAQQYEWDDAPRFSWSAFDPTSYDKDCAVVGPHTIEFEVPDNFDFRPVRIATLQARKAELQAKLAAEITGIDEQIQKLLALPGVSEVQA
jgi:hypothetical protein